MHDDGVTPLSGDVGPPGSLCGILGVHVNDQVNGGRGTRWENAMKRLRLTDVENFQCVDLTLARV